MSGAGASRTVIFVCFLKWWWNNGPWTLGVNLTATITTKNSPSNQSGLPFYLIKTICCRGRISCVFEQPFTFTVRRLNHFQSPDDWNASMIHSLLLQYNLIWKSKSYIFAFQGGMCGRRGCLIIFLKVGIEEGEERSRRNVIPTNNSPSMPHVPDISDSINARARPNRIACRAWILEWSCASL